MGSAVYISIDKELYARAMAQARKLGHSSVDEYVIHLIESNLDKGAEHDRKDEVMKRLRGLGYLS